MKPFGLTKEQLDEIKPLAILNQKQQNELQDLQRIAAQYKMAVEICNLLKTKSLTDKSGNMPLYNRAETKIKDVIGYTVSLSLGSGGDIEGTFEKFQPYIKCYLRVFRLDRLHGRIILDAEMLEKKLTEAQAELETYTYYVENFHLLKAQKIATERVVNEAGNGLPECFRFYADHYRKDV